jgi:hypothetical protein
VEIPNFGTVSCTTIKSQNNSKTLSFYPESTLAEELGALSGINSSKNANVIRKDINLGKIAEVSMLPREQAKNIIQAFSV